MRIPLSTTAHSKCVKINQIYFLCQIFQIQSIPHFNGLPRIKRLIEFLLMVPKSFFPVRNECTFMRTSQPIPRSLKSFRWETKVTDGDNDFAIGIGFASELPEVGKGFPPQMDAHMTGLDLYDGSLWRGMNEENILTEKPRNGDVIGCHLQYIEKDGHEY